MAQEHLKVVKRTFFGRMDENIPALSKWCCLEAFKYLRASKKHSFVTPVHISIGFQWFSSGLSCFEEKHHLHITPSSQPTTLKTATYPTVCPFPKKPPAGTQPQDSETPKNSELPLSRGLLFSSKKPIDLLINHYDITGAHPFRNAQRILSKGETRSRDLLGRYLVCLRSMALNQRKAINVLRLLKVPEDLALCSFLRIWWGPGNSA